MTGTASSSSPRGVRRRRAVWLLVALFAGSVAAVAQYPVAAAPQAAPASTAIGTQTQQAPEASDLVIGNRRIFTARVTNEYGTTPAGRTAGVNDRIRALLDSGGPLRVTTAETNGYVAILVDGVLVFRVLPGDIDAEALQTPQQVAADAARTLELALRELRESRDSSALLAATGKATLATAVLVALLWLLTKGCARLSDRIRASVRRRSDTLVPPWGRDLVGQTGLGDLLAVPVKLLGWVIGTLVVSEWAALVLGFFPYTRPWGETLFRNLVDAVGSFGAAVLGAVPGLLFVALIFVITRFVVRILRAFFEGVHSGRVEVRWLDETTARPTGRLLVVVVWLFSFVAAYPYIPGSDSEAFKGIGVFVGLMLSIGSSGVVNQAVSGLMLMYTKMLRPGEFVQIADNEGTVTAIGFLTTRIETLRNVEVAIPNAVIVGNVTRNYSRLAARGGMRLATSVTIGYDTPWRQVAAMLQIAAKRTAQIAADPAPRVLQTALQDFYVEYTLVVCLADPKRKMAVLDELHGHIQDVFNEFGVQIMSPHYENDPGTPKVVPRAQWDAAPAASIAEATVGAGNAAPAAAPAVAAPTRDP